MDQEYTTEEYRIDDTDKSIKVTYDQFGTTRITKDALESLISRVNSKSVSGADTELMKFIAWIEKSDKYYISELVKCFEDPRFDKLISVDSSKLIEEYRSYREE